MVKRKFNKVVIIHQGALGDLINTIPAIQAVRENCKLLIGIGSDRLKLLQYCGIIDQAILSEVIAFHTLFSENFQPPPNLKEIFSGAELAVSWLGRGSKTYQKNLASLAKKISIFQEPFPPGPGSEHITKILAKPVMDAGIEIQNFLPQLCIPTPDSLARPDPRVCPILVHPGSGSLKKALPLPKLFQLLEMLAEIFPDQKLAIISGEVEKRMIFEFVKVCPEKLKPKVQLIPDLPLLRLAELLSRAELYLGMDSGPTHLAAALGVKTIAVFGPTDPKVWAPLQKNVKVIASNYACAPCADEKRRECEEPKCMETIDREAIIKTVTHFKLDLKIEKPA